MLIKLTIDRFEGDKAVLKTNDGLTVLWPKNKLPENSKEGSLINFTINKDLETEDEKRILAKNILNEILDIKE